MRESKAASVKTACDRHPSESGELTSSQPKKYVKMVRNALQQLGNAANAHTTVAQCDPCCRWLLAAAGCSYHKVDVIA